MKVALMESRMVSESGHSMDEEMPVDLGQGGTMAGINSGEIPAAMLNWLSFLNYSQIMVTTSSPPSSWLRYLAKVKR